ncbi:MAG: hypothetical protein WCG27_05630 [Pseudomonadota bacterium]
MPHIVFGLIFIGLGLWGLFDQWYYIIDLLKGALPVAMTLFGIFAIWIAFFTTNEVKTVRSNHNEKEGFEDEI